MDPSLIVGGLDLLGGILGGISDDKANKVSFDNNVKMFNMTNEYNTPLAQRRRMEAAGMNPALMYGSGTVANTASQPKAPEVKPVNYAQNLGAGAGFGLTQYFETRLKEEQIANAEKQREVMDAQIRSYETGSNLKEVDTSDKEFELQLKNRLRNNSIQIAEAENYNKQAQGLKMLIENTHADERQKLAIEESIARISAIKANGSYTELQNQIAREKLELNKNGIDWRDPVYARILAQFFELDEEQLIRKKK